MAALFGIPFVAAKVEENSEGDFWPAVDAGGIFCLDNADSRVKWLADSLAAAATDGCSSRRRLYTDRERIVLRPRAWICVTTANPTFAADAGLADRLLVVRMNRREVTASDTALTDEIIANRDAGLSFIAQTLSAALADTVPTPAGLNRRHPDFGSFSVRIGRALGREREAVEALSRAESDKSLFCLENHPVGAALMAYVRQAGSFEGTAADLLPALRDIDSDLERVSVKGLSKRLGALWPHLEAQLHARRDVCSHSKIATFRFNAAGFAGFQVPFPEKSPVRENIGTFRETPFQSPQTPQAPQPAAWFADP